jgi:hypothetical protein
MSPIVPADARRSRRGIVAGVILTTLFLAPAMVRAQALSEILQGSVHAPTDVFECGRQAKGNRKECGLRYRFYCVDYPDEVNSPSMPRPGYAGFRPKRQIYLSDSAHTSNFPKAGGAGPGHVWSLLWDGIRDADTPGHIGYYAAVSQIVEHGEIGNPQTVSCLPVIGQYACFGQIGADKASFVHNTPLGDIAPVGGLSPIPVPLLARNGMDSVTFVWEQAASRVSRDGAPLPIEGYRLYIFPDPVNLPTEAELAESAVAVGEVIPVDTTFLELKRTDAALVESVTLSAAIRTVYTGKLESLYFSANGPATGLAFPDTAATKEIDDAATGTGAVSRSIDIEDLFLEVRQKKGADEDSERAYLVATVDLVGEPTGQLMEGTTVKLFIDFNDDGLASIFTEPGKSSTQDITLEARLAQEEDEKVRATFSGLPGIETDSRIDGRRGRITFAVPLDEVTGAASNEQLRAADAGGGQRQILVWAETTRGGDTDRVPNTDDGKAPSVAGEVIRFTF